MMMFASKKTSLFTPYSNSYPYFLQTLMNSTFNSRLVLCDGTIDSARNYFDAIFQIVYTCIKKRQKSKN
jgi:hypothetical protein